QVALGPREVVPGAHEARELLVLVHPGRVRGRAGVAHEQHARVAVRERLGARRLPVDRPLGRKPDVAVHVHEPGQHDALEDLVDLGRTLEGEPVPQDPHAVRLLLVAEHDEPAQLEGHQRKNFSSWLRSMSPEPGSGLGWPSPKALPGAAPPPWARSRAARSSAARFAGLPDLPLRFLGGGAWRPRAFLPMPGIAPMPGTPPPRAICFIIFCAPSKRSRSWLTSEAVVPEPLAMRARREPLMILGFCRSAGVIERTIASMRSTSRSSKFSIASR